MIQIENPFRTLLGAGVMSLSVMLLGCGGGDEPAALVIPNPDPVIGQTANTSIGKVFVLGDENLTLYTFTNDEDGVSNCSTGCLANWPAAIADSAMTEGEFSTFDRGDGLLQWALKNRPLYFYQGDAAEGDVSGEGLGTIWYVARPDPVTTGETSSGTVLVGNGSVSDGSDDPASRTDVDGMTLYTFKNDTLDTSVCNDQCAVNWPPLYADKDARAAAGFTLLTRSDNTVQWAKAGQALYFYQGDAAPGDTNGDGIGGVWDVALP